MIRGISLAGLLWALIAAPSLAADRRDARILLEIDFALAKITLKQGRTLVYEVDRAPRAPAPSTKSTTTEQKSDAAKSAESAPKSSESSPGQFTPDEIKKLTESLRSNSSTAKLQPAPVTEMKTDSKLMLKPNWGLSAMMLDRAIRISAGAFNFELDIVLRMP